MADYRIAFPKTAKWEGGFQNNPADNANYCDNKLIGTNRGVSAIGYKAAYGRCPTVSEIKAITQEQAAYIFKRQYWDAVKGDLINNQSVAELVADWAWGSGPVTAIKYVQRALGLTADGQLGTKTLAALNDRNASRVFVTLHAAREQHFRDIAAANPAKAQFLNGWLNRLRDFTFEGDTTKKP